jgi:hypothetical protein
MNQNERELFLLSHWTHYAESVKFYLRNFLSTFRIHTSAVTTGRSTLLLFITQGVKIKNFYYEHDLFAC